jgi:type VI secretion system secreted protein Hcp
MATDIYLYFKQPDVPGDSEDNENKDAIEILSFSNGSSMPITEGRSFAGSGTSGIANFGEFNFTKLADSATVPLLKHVWEGTHFKQVLVRCYRATGPNSRICYLEITMEGAVIVSSQLSAGSSGIPTEGYAIDYSKITYKYMDTDKVTGKSKNPQAISYNRLSNEIA